MAAITPGEVMLVGGDEARMALNRCPRCRARGLSNAELYFDHMAWVIRETKRLGKRPMIAGDMLLKNPSLIKRIDRAAVIMDWHYDLPASARDTIDLFPIAWVRRRRDHV